MLVLSRKIGQQIVVGDSVRITVTKVAGNRVTLGVEAPDNVRILRGELEPIVCSFEDDEDEEEVSCSRAAPPMSGDDDVHTIPFLPQSAK